MSTHNMCFCGEIRKIISRYPPLSRHMDYNTTVTSVKFCFPDFLLLNFIVALRANSDDYQ